MNFLVMHLLEHEDVPFIIHLVHPGSLGSLEARFFNVSNLLENSCLFSWGQIMTQVKSIAAILKSSSFKSTHDSP
jgi:hypothetical protein